MTCKTCGGRGWTADSRYSPRGDQFYENRKPCPDCTWRDLDTLEYDGRQVEFKAPAGNFKAPAVRPAPLTREEKLEMYQITGEFPHVKFIPTHWRETQQ